MKRKSLSRLQRTKIFDAAHGICCLCGVPIRAGRGEVWVEHLKPLWLGGADDASNWGPAHRLCAIDKTAGEAPQKAKGDRARANYLGIRKRSRGRPLPGTRASGIRIRMNGNIERWPNG
jgi:hypothetical protein